MRWTAGVRFSAEARDFSLLHSVQTVSADHRASYAMGGGFLFSGLKRLEREDGRSPPSSAEVKNIEAIPPIPHTSLWLVIQLSRVTTLAFTFMSVSIFFLQDY
jgi:hypothetical protein